MNQEKIGKLIAYLRKKQNLTQSELGAKVGVGDRAVSKWERGITCPDISIINDLSKILGITSDELLAGELNDKKKMNEIKNNNFNKKLLFIPLIILIAIITTIIIVNHNKMHVYTLESANDEYEVFGKVLFSNDNTNIIINKVIFKDKDLNIIMIKNYEYTIRCNNDFFYRKGYLNSHELLLETTTINDFASKFRVDYTWNNTVSESQIINNGIILTITMLDEYDNVITKEIKMTLEKEK